MAFSIASTPGFDWMPETTKSKHRTRPRYIKSFEIVKDHPVIVDGKDVQRVARKEWNRVNDSRTGEVRYYTNLGTRERPHTVSLESFILARPTGTVKQKRRDGSDYSRRNLRSIDHKPKVWLSDEEFEAKKLQEQIARLQSKLARFKA